MATRPTPREYQEEMTERYKRHFTFAPEDMGLMELLVSSPGRIPPNLRDDAERMMRARIDATPAEAAEVVEALVQHDERKHQRLMGAVPESVWIGAGAGQRAEMLEAAMAVAPWLSPYTDDDEIALTSVALSTLARSGEALPTESAAQVLFFARWAESGFPIIALTSEQAASLMLTDVGDADLAEVQAPWRAFLITVPEGDGVRWNEEGSGTTYTLQSVCVLKAQSAHGGAAGRGGGAWTILALFKGTRVVHERGREIEVTLGITLWQLNKTAQELRDRSKLAWELADSYGAGSQAQTLLEPDLRVTELIARMVLNTCILLGGTKDALTKRPIPKVRKRKGEKKRAPTARERAKWGEQYVLGAPIFVDLREKVDEYVERGPRALQGKRGVRSLVRGHYRNQAYGPRYSMHRKVWIQPHWSPTDESMAVIVRETKLKENTGMPRSNPLGLPLTFSSGGDQLGDQWDGYIVAFDGERRVGRLLWTLWRGEYSVKGVEVDPEYRRRGVATALYRKLLEEEGIDLEQLPRSMTTPEGTALREALER